MDSPEVNKILTYGIKLWLMQPKLEEFYILNVNKNNLLSGCWRELKQVAVPMITNKR